MKCYHFRDWDEEQKIEYDIQGQDYLDLLSVCFQYCNSFVGRYSTSRDIKVEIPSFLHKSRLPLTKKITEVYRQYGYGLQGPKDVLVHFSLSAEVMDFLIKRTDDFFCWIADPESRNLEDLAFFRKDGSVFLHSSTHNGTCVLEVFDTEDVSRIISKPGWEEKPSSGPVVIKFPQHST